MLNPQTNAMATEAKRIYEARFRSVLEASHRDEFVVIEPISGEHFLGSTLSAAIGASRSKYPDRLAHAFRVGHKAAIHFGCVAMGESSSPQHVVKTRGRSIAWARLKTPDPSHFAGSYNWNRCS